MPIRNLRQLMKAIAMLLSFTMAVYPFHSFGITPNPAGDGRRGQAAGREFSNAFSFPTESGGMVEFGDGRFAIDDITPKGDGLYLQQPDTGELRGAYDSESAMEGIGMRAQSGLYQDAQLDEPTTVSGSVYKIVLGVSGARDKIPDLTNDPIVVGSGDAMVDENLLESFGDCSVQTEVTETTRPVHVPDEEFCERVTTPAPATCAIKRELVIERVEEPDSFTQSGVTRASHNCGEVIIVDGRAGRALCSGAYQSYTITANTGRPSYVTCFNQQAWFRSSCAYTHNWSVTITAGTKTTSTVTTDRWYPEECIERARRSK